MNSIADTIKSLKPGDRVRVVHEVVVVAGPDYDGDVLVEDDYYLIHDDPTITSIEVIERPLQVGDRVVAADQKHEGTIVGRGEFYAIVVWADCIEAPAQISDLRRAS